MNDLYSKTCSECSNLITNRYSTSFSLGIKCFDKKFRAPICGIYGLVRFADEIVDTFHDQDKKKLLERFKKDTYTALNEGISLNPVIHSFQRTFHEFHIDREHVDAFFYSMEMDLNKSQYQQEGYDEYIYGSAEVVGLMCLRVFCEGNDHQYQQLKASARSLGSAFQKVNFLRDMKSDFDERGRIYFPGLDYTQFNVTSKAAIEKDIEKDFADALVGIKLLPTTARFGVYTAYMYYTKLFSKIIRSSPSAVIEKRIRVNDAHKIWLLAGSALKSKLNMI